MRAVLLKPSLSLLLPGLLVVACQGTAPLDAPDLGATTEADGGDAGSSASVADGGADGAVPDEDGAVPEDGGASDSEVVDGGHVLDGGVGPAPSPLRGRFESARPMRICDDIVPWRAPDGLLLRPTFDTCGGDDAALARSILANLDDARSKGGRVLLIIAQGPFLPSSWTDACETFELSTPRFSGTSCLPWDPTYQARLRRALVDVIGPVVRGHPALAGVYFTISTMTNGSEMHFRASRSTLPNYPGDAALRVAYRQVMDTYQEAFEVPILFEGGHCLFDNADADCETPRDLYRYARDTYGLGHLGVALWNCAERFFTTERSPDFASRPLIEELVQDGASLGCQTVGNFTDGACHFTDDEIADYGTPPSGVGAACPASPTYDSEAACEDTLRWFVGRSARNPNSVASLGTWGEIWSQDFSPGGVYNSSAACRDAIDLLAP